MSVGDVLIVRDHSKNSEYFKKLDEVSPATGEQPSWIKADRKKISLTIVSLPERDHSEADINEQLIVEYYSR